MLPVVAFVARCDARDGAGIRRAARLADDQDRRGSQLKEQSRGTIGSSRQLRSGRWLVGLQLALSLPLLVGAGLLARTVYNLQRPDLGFRRRASARGAGRLGRDRA